MTGWVDRITGQKGKSVDNARERLRLVLINDRTDLTPDDFDSLKNELMEVISRYVEIDPEEIKISMAQDGREQRLVADIPLKTTHRRKIR